jgi:hypothetical protein
MCCCGTDEEIQTPALRTSRIDFVLRFVWLWGSVVASVGSYLTVTVYTRCLVLGVSWGNCYALIIHINVYNNGSLWSIDWGRDSSVSIATRYGLDSRGSNPGEGEIFRTRSDRPWGPPNFLYSAYRVSFALVKRPGRGVDHPLPSSAEVKERAEL